MYDNKFKWREKYGPGEEKMRKKNHVRTTRMASGRRGQTKDLDK